MDNVSTSEGVPGDVSPSESVPGITGPGQIVTSLKRRAVATPYRFRNLLALDDFERHARRLLPPMIFHYVADGVETGAALRAGREAYAGYSIVPRCCATCRDAIRA